MPVKPRSINFQKGFSVIKILVIIFGVFFLGLVVLYFHLEHPFFKIPDEKNVPKFITHDFIDLERVTAISKFRSGGGHDYSDSDETCRSMKHYFQPGSRVPIDPDTYTPQEPFINIYSPVDGIITAIDNEGFKVGKQIHIEPFSNPEYTIRIFHTYLVGIKRDSVVKAGQKIGYIGDHQGTDIAIKKADKGIKGFLPSLDCHDQNFTETWVAFVSNKPWIDKTVLYGRFRGLR